MLQRKLLVGPIAVAEGLASFRETPRALVGRRNGAEIQEADPPNPTARAGERGVEGAGAVRDRNTRKTLALSTAVGSRFLGRHVLSVLVILLLTGSPALGAYIWSGLGPNDNWTNNANWQGGTAPPRPGDFTNDLEFNLATGDTTVANQGEWKLNSITFGAGAGAFTINGNADQRIRVDNYIRNNSASLQTFTAGITIRPQGGAAPTIDAAAGNILFTDQANREIHLYEQGVIFTGPNNIDVNRPITSANVTAAEVAVTKNGGGNLDLRKNSSYNGATEVNDGRIRMRHQGALGNATGDTTVNSGGAIYLLNGADGGNIGEDLNLNGNGYNAQGALRSRNNNTYNWTGSVNLASDTRIATDDGTRINFNTNVSGTGALEKTGSGVVRLTNNGNNYTGLTTVAAGTLEIRRGGSLGTTAAGTVVNDGARLRLRRTGNNNYTVSGEALTLNGTGDGNGALHSSDDGTYTWDGPVTLATTSRIHTDGGSRINLLGDITGPGGLQKNGNGTLEIDEGTNTFAGDVTVNGGTLIADVGTQLLGAGGNLNVNSGGTLEVRGVATINASQNINLDGGFADMRLNNNNTWGNDIYVSGDSRLRVGRVSSSGNTDRVHGFGTVTWTTDSTLDIDRQNNHTATFTDFDVSGVDARRIGNAPITVGSISGQRIFFDQGTATVTGPVGVTSFRVGDSGNLDATVNYDGGANTLSTSGWLQISNNNGGSGTYVFNLDSGNVDVGNHAAVGRNDDSTATINVNAGAFDVGGNLRMAEGNNSTARVNVDAGTLTVSGNVTDSANGASTIEVNGGTLNLTGGTIAVDRLIFRNGNINNVAGATLTGDNGVNFALIMRRGKTIDFPITLQGDMRWENNNNGTGKIDGTVDLDGGTRTFNVQDGNNTVDLRINGVISNGGLTKTGGGTLRLTADNTYTGPTSVNNGTLRVDGSIALSSGVDVASGATLEGRGVVSTISGAGLVSPGISPGILTAPAIDPTGGLDFGFEFTQTGSPDYTNDSASVNDVLHIDGGTPFQSDLDGANLLRFYFDVSGLSQGDWFRGGFYTDDGATDFLSSVVGASKEFYISGSGGSHVFNGVEYFAVDQIYPDMSFILRTVPETGHFDGGSVNGRVLQLFAIVPEPTALLVWSLLAGLGIGAAWWRRKR